MSRQLVQPGDTRWLSHDGSIAIVGDHYTAICHALESIYVDAGDPSCDARGLRFQLRKSSATFA
jgi:hypothetical protein